MNILPQFPEAQPTLCWVRNTRTTQRSPGATQLYKAVFDEHFPIKARSGWFLPVRRSSASAEKIVLSNPKNDPVETSGVESGARPAAFGARAIIPTHQSLVIRLFRRWSGATHSLPSSEPLPSSSPQLIRGCLFGKPYSHLSCISTGRSLSAIGTRRVGVEGGPPPSVSRRVKTDSYSIQGQPPTRADWHR